MTNSAQLSWFSRNLILVLLWVFNASDLNKLVLFPCSNSRHINGIATSCSNIGPQSVHVGTAEKLYSQA